MKVIILGIIFSVIINEGYPQKCITCRGSECDKNPGYIECTRHIPKLPSDIIQQSVDSGSTSGDYKCLTLTYRDEVSDTDAKSTQTIKQCIIAGNEYEWCDHLEPNQRVLYCKTNAVMFEGGDTSAVTGKDTDTTSTISSSTTTHEKSTSSSTPTKSTTTPETTSNKSTTTPKATTSSTSSTTTGPKKTSKTTASTRNSPKTETSKSTPEATTSPTNSTTTESKTTSKTSTSTTTSETTTESKTTSKTSTSTTPSSTTETKSQSKETKSTTSKPNDSSKVIITIFLVPSVVFLVFQMK